jgi:hypothetical protein
MSKKSKKPAEKQLPRFIYGHWYEPGTTDEFLRTSDDPGTLVETGETLRVGVYELTGYATVKSHTTINVQPKRSSKGR